MSVSLSIVVIGYEISLAINETTHLNLGSTYSNARDVGIGLQR